MKNYPNHTPEQLLLTAIFGAYALVQSVGNMAEAPRKPLVRMRGIRDAIAYIKRADAYSAVTYGFVRKLIDNKKITSVQAGRKILINLDELTAYLNTGGRI
jgi:excisionase family DNA binding protein